METLEELSAFLISATRDGFRNRLQARGEARAIIREDGMLPEDAPHFAESIDVDLTEYGLSLLRASLALRELGGDNELWRRGFLRAGNAFEVLVQNSSAEPVDHGFFRVIGAAAYHLGGYSALAFSLLVQRQEDSNLAPAEEALVLLMLRDLSQLGIRARNWLLDGSHSDESISLALQNGEFDPNDAVATIVTTTVFRSIALFEFALQTGFSPLVEEAKHILHRAMAVSKNAGGVTLWWITRIALNLIGDLWASSLHNILPQDGPIGSENYQTLRRLFIGELYSRKVSEVELWPSQIEAAERSIDISDDLVVALPTSAGKTRIAELATLMALSCGTRVLVVTPLRALSAQTERSFRKTFSTLGFSVSSLYGSSGMAGGDEDALRSQDIVIATPEKLDFALRNDPTIIDDVGLVVLDEGHLIGPSDREIRYENLVQRLLRRHDSENRRIVCLSAILPDGDQLNDLTAWIRKDAEGSPVKCPWRPTRQRFGTLTWQTQAGRLDFNLEPDAPYISRFIHPIAPIPPRRTPFPKNNQEFTLAAAWKFSSQGKRALVFCTQRNHVESYAKIIIGLHLRGFLPPLLENIDPIRKAIAIGEEWLGHDHPAVVCLPIGVAIHHGRLPSPFLRELEALLSQGLLSVIVASPTLAQGLNLNAAVLLIPALYRAGELIKGEEFANVAGRAGRAFVDLEGLILHVMYSPDPSKKRVWRDLVRSVRARSLTSGILMVVAEVLKRLARTGILNRGDAMEYLANSQVAWLQGPHDDDQESIDGLLERLDTTVLGLIEALDADCEDLPQLLEEALQGSLWSRQLARFQVEHQQAQFMILEARARLIWNKSTPDMRRAQFAMGIGLEAGQAIEAIAGELNASLELADRAAVSGDIRGLTSGLVSLAERLLFIRPFSPDETLPGGWPELLSQWVQGTDVHTIGVDNMRVIEDAFVYRLVWAIEALRMRRRANGEAVELFEGKAAATLESGLPQYTMAMLVRAGLPSRAAAIDVINQLQPNITDFRGLQAWMDSDEVMELTEHDDWPTPSTAAIWKDFRNQVLLTSTKKWSTQEWQMEGPFTHPFEPNVPYRIIVSPENGETMVASPDFRPLQQIRHRLRQLKPSLLHAIVSPEGQSMKLYRMGLGSARWADPR